MSRRQGARWLELRAAEATRISLWSTAAPPKPATLLAATLSWFTEGRDTMDYLYAEGLLKTLE